MTLTAFDVYACQQVWKWEHPQHSFLHNLAEGAGQVLEDVGEHLAESGAEGLIETLL